MVKIISKEIAVLFLFLFLISFASATFTLGNQTYSITESYGPGESIKGWVNISFNDESSNASFESSLGNISLIDLLSKTSNGGFEHTCIPSSSSCTTPGYLTSNGNNIKTFNLNANQSVLFGLVLNGGANRQEFLQDIKPSSFSFNLTSNNPETDVFPLAIYILDNSSGVYKWQDNLPSTTLSNKNFGCFTETNYAVPENIVSEPQYQYCEKIKLNKAPRANIGAYVQYKTGNTNVQFIMTIKNSTGIDKATCTTASATGNPVGEIVNCDVKNYPINGGDYYVCIQSSGNDNDYKIDSEQINPICGFSGTFQGTYDRDFDIFGQTYEYASNINLSINDQLVKSGPSLEQRIKTYIGDMYGNNCSTGCIIPIRIFSGINQNIQIQESGDSGNPIPYITYLTDVSTDVNTIFDLQQIPSQISSGFQKLYLDDAGFLTPLEFGNQTFSLNLDGINLFSNQITIGEVPVISAITPSSTAVDYPTTFSAIINSTTNITSFNWDFGDGTTPKTTNTGSVTYAYNATGTYVITVNATDITGKSSSKAFNITVGPISSILPTLLQEMGVNLETIKAQITNFPQFEQDTINQVLNLNGIEENLTALNNSAMSASSDQEFQSILTGLLNMKIPKTIAETASSNSIVFYPEKDNIDLDILQKIGGGTYDTNNEDAYKNAILAWEQQNSNMMLTYNELTIVYDNYEQPLKIFQMSISKTGTDNAYIIIKNMSNLLFKQDYSQKEQNGYYYIPLTESQMNIAFSTTDNVDFISLPLFISPSLSSISIAQWSPLDTSGHLKTWILFTIIVVAILLVALIVWVVLQMWYKRKYENFLFKDRNSLYNLVNFIEVEREKGTEEKNIAANLKKTGWTSEQIVYAMKKHAGKRTGLPEIIPIDKILRIFKKNKKIIPQKKIVPPKTNPQKK